MWNNQGNNTPAATTTIVTTTISIWQQQQPQEQQQQKIWQFEYEFSPIFFDWKVKISSVYGTSKITSFPIKLEKHRNDILVYSNYMANRQNERWKEMRDELREIFFLLKRKDMNSKKEEDGNGKFEANEIVKKMRIMLQPHQ